MHAFLMSERAGWSGLPGISLVLLEIKFFFPWKNNQWKQSVLLEKIYCKNLENVID